MRYPCAGPHSNTMHARSLLTTLVLLPIHLLACTAYVMHADGRTFIGNNEDSWCIDARVRFIPGQEGRLGAVYFSTHNGHPFRDWGDQIGMNEAGLVFDGLGIQPKEVAPEPGKPVVQFQELMRNMLERYRNVPEAVAFLQEHDLGFLHRSMIFLADAHGLYAVVQNDTVMIGNDPHFAVGNWRLGCDTDVNEVPIPRLQDGRDLLKAGVGGSLEEALSVLERMKVCREFLGNGTLFSTLFEPDSGRAHLYFYHDFEHPVTFDLRTEMAKGPHTVDLPSLFPPNAEFQALQAYKTPFHQRWLFWGLMAWGGLAVLLGIVCGITVMVNGVRRIRRLPVRATWPLIVSGIAMVVLVGLIGVFLTQENVFYFGLGDVHPVLVSAPFALLAISIVLILRVRRNRNEAWYLMPTLILLIPVLIAMGYWHMW